MTSSCFQVAYRCCEANVDVTVQGHGPAPRHLERLDCDANRVMNGVLESGQSTQQADEGFRAGKGKRTGRATYSLRLGVLGRVDNLGDVLSDKLAILFQSAFTLPLLQEGNANLGLVCYLVDE